MTSLRQRADALLRGLSDRDLLVAVGVAAVVVGAAGAVLGKAGLLLAGLALGAVLAVAALLAPPVALAMVVLATFFRTAQKEVLPGEVLVPALGLMTVAVALALVRRTVPRPRAGVCEGLMLAFLAWNLLSTVIPHEFPAEVPVTGGVFDLERWFLGAIVLPFLVYQAARVVVVGERALRWLLWVVVAMTAVSTWLSIAQFHAPALTWPAYVVEEPNWPGRANGIFNQPVVNGVILVVGLVVCLFLAGRPGTARAPRIGLYVLVAATAYAVYLTHTRAAVLGLVAAVVLGALLAKGWRTGFLVVGGLGALGLATQASTLFSPDRSEGGFGSPSEVYDRLNAAATAVHAIVHHPVVGIGVGRFGMYNTYEHQAWSDSVDWSSGQMIIAHENDLGIGAEVGLPGLAMWLALIATMAVLLWRARRSLPGDGIGGGGLAVVGLVALAVMMVSGTTVDLRPLEFATTLPFALAGAIVGRYERHRDDPGPEPGAAAREPDAQPVVDRPRRPSLVALSVAGSGAEAARSRSPVPADTAGHDVAAVR